ncbi:MAG: DUF2155 domain-containing protein [Thermodesulfovibrionales bacterium]|nr:DUF2155 domain-containing protein [Thermodesulfovibrionales bacterium]
MLVSGCKKDEKAKAEENEQRLKNIMKQDLAKLPHAPMPAEKKDKKDVPIVVSEQVKAKWKNITLTITDKTKKSETDITISVGGKGNIAGTNVAIEIKEFLPHFMMDAKGIISETNELKNPAVRVVIIEKDKTIYTGWIFKKHPSVPLFMHDVFEIKLKNAGM